MSSDRVIQRARDLIGTPFRLHGRDPARGIDCVGLIALATGRGTDAPAGYSLRSARGAEDWLVQLDHLGSRTEPEPGSVLLLRAGPGQAHLGILTKTGLIHADAGLRRVVETPLPLPWPLSGAWRISCKD